MNKIIFVSVIFVIAFGPSFIVLYKKYKAGDEARKRKFINLVLAIPIITTIPFAGLFDMNRTVTSFILYGVVSMIVDIIFIGIYWNKRKGDLLKDTDRSVSRAVLILAGLLISFFSLYAMYCFFFSMLM